MSVNYLGFFMLLYKYLTAERIDVLENLKIRFTQAGSLNDPFELKPYFPYLLSENSKRESIEEGVRQAYKDSGFDKQMSFSKFYALAKHRLPHAIKQFNEGVGRQKLDEVLSYLRESVGILSLSENIDHLLMWSHYSDSHSGFAIAFDTENTFFSEFSPQGERQYFGLGKVEYSHKRLHLTIDELGDSKALFWKPECWLYEDEWRFIKNFKKRHDFLVDEDKVFLFDIPPSCIHSVYCGANMSSFNVDKIKDLVKSEQLSHVAVNQMSLCEKEFALKVEALN